MSDAATTDDSSATPTAEPVATDGRAARRQRNMDTAIDAAVQMFREGWTRFTLEEVAERTDLSARSLYRYFADWTELRDAAIDRTQNAAVRAVTIEGIGEGGLEERIDSFVNARLRLHRGFGAIQQAMLAHAFVSDHAAGQVERNRNLLRRQLEAHFAPELERFDEPAQIRVIAAADLLTQLESVHTLRTTRRFTVKETAAVLSDGLRSLLT